MNFEEMAQAAFENSKAHGFHDAIPPRFSVPLRVVLIHSELSEVLEEYRNWPIDQVKAPDALVEELADVLIRLGDLVAFPEIGIERFVKAVEAKMEKNKTRPMRHGGKRI